MNKTRRGFLLKRTTVALLGVGVMLGAGLMGAVMINAQGPRTVNYTPQERTTLETLESAFTKLVADVAPSVVSIKVTKRVAGRSLDIPFEFGLPREFENRSQRLQVPPRMVQGGGSGVIMRSDGYIMTNDHVVGDADEVEVVLNDGRTLRGKVLRDFQSDIALVKVERNGLPAVEFGDSASVKPGQFAVAMGAPYGLANTITVGHISALKRQSAIGDPMGGGTRFYPNMIQTDAAINPGNSGGPLINIDGEVIGINTAIESGNTGGSIGIGFAIPINTAKRIAEQLIREGKVSRGFLGIAPQDLTPEDKDRSGLKGGALVARVTDGSPASRAGIRTDDIITDFNGKPVDSEFTLRELISEAGPGATVTIKLLRDKRPVTVTAKLDDPPRELTGRAGSDAASPSSDESVKLGVSVRAMSETLRERYQIRSGLAGVVVADVAPGSPAADAGISEGDVILRVNGESVSTPEALKRTTVGLKDGDSVRLTVWHREGETAGEAIVVVKIR